MKYYLIYKISNLINNKIYIGAHETFNKNDSYMGSGKVLGYAIKKYGLSFFKKEILFECKSRDEMYQKEAELVNEEFVARLDTYNVKVGGNGGWNYVNDTVDREYRSKCIRDAMANIPQEVRQEQLEKQHVALQLHWKEFGHNWSGRKHSEQTKEKMRKPHPTACGEGNSQYGTRWICNDLTKETKKILKTDSIPDGWRQGRIYKK